jgi:acylphosphatase
MGEQTGALIYVEGMVQGVGYRNFVVEWAQRLGLKGYCQNLWDGRVLVEVEGNKTVIKLLIEQLRQGPRRARVTAVKVDWKPCAGCFSGFEIRYQ